MTVNEYKETACATAGPVEDMEVEGEPILNTTSPAHDSENLLGRVLAGNTILIPFINRSFTIFYISDQIQ